MKKVWVQVLLALLVFILIAAGGLTALVLTKKCVEGTYSCKNGAVVRCMDNAWQRTTSCEYGCEENPVRCKEASQEEFVIQPPEEPAESASPELVENNTPEMEPPEETSLPGEITSQQSLRFYKNGMLVFDQNGEGAPFANVYFTIQRDGGKLYTSSIIFNPGIPYTSAESLAGWTFTLQGKTVTIATAELWPNKKVRNLKLEMGESSPLILINNSIYVNDATLVNPRVLAGVTYSIVSDGKLLKSIIFEYTPSYNVYFDLATTYSYQDPLLQQFGIVYKAVKEYPKEQVSFSSQGTTGRVTFKNVDGKQINLPLFSEGRSIYLGTSNRDKIFMEGDVCPTSLTATSIYDECQRLSFFVIDDGKAKLYQITNLQLGTGKISIKPLTYTEKLESGVVTYDFNLGKPTQFPLPGLKQPITLIIGQKSMNFTKLGTATGSRIDLLGGAYLEIMNKNSLPVFEGFTFGEVQGTGDKFPDSKLSDVAVIPQVTENRITYQLSDISLGYEGFGFLLSSLGESNIHKFMTNKGTLYTYDRIAKNTFTIDYPAHPTYGTVVFTAPGTNYELGKNDFYLGKSLGDYTITAEQVPGLLGSGVVTKKE